MLLPAGPPVPGIAARNQGTEAGGHLLPLPPLRLRRSPAAVAEAAAATAAAGHWRCPLQLHCRALQWSLPQQVHVLPPAQQHGPQQQLSLGALA